MKVTLLKGSKSYELMQDKDPKSQKASQKTAKRISLYCEKAEACFYEIGAIRKLREEFKDVL